MNENDEVMSNMDSLRSINNCLYIKPSQSSLMCRRQVKIQPFSSGAAASPNDTIYVICNISDDMVYGPTSVMKFQYTITNASAAPPTALTARLGLNNTILSLFKSIRITHRSGQQIAFVDEVGIYATIQRLYRYNDTQRKALDALLNYHPDLGLDAGDNVFISMIPLSLFDGFFDSVELIPAQALAGAKVEFQLHPNNRVFVNTTGAEAAVIKELSIKASLLLDCCTPLDSVVRELVQQTSDSTQAGLQYAYETNFYTSQTISNPQFSIDIQNAVSVAPRAMLVCQSSEAATGTEGQNKMAFKTAVSQIQWRLGSDYFPSQQTQSVDVNTGFEYSANQSEQYKDAVIALQAYPHQFGGPQIYGSSVSLSETDPEAVYNNIGGYASAAATDDSAAVYGIVLDLSPAAIAGRFSGMQSNNSRLLNVAGSITDAGANTGKVLRIYQTSLRVLNCAGDSAIVDR